LWLPLILILTIGCGKSKSGTERSDKISGKVKLDSLVIQKVRFQTQWLPQAQFAGVYIAYEKGFYKDYGIEVEILSGGPEQSSTSALRNNKADIVSMFLTTALREVDQGQKITNIAQLSQKSSLLFVAKKSSGIKRLQDLNGKKIGLWVNDFKEPSLILLRKYKIKAEIVPISWTTNVLAQDVVDVMNMMYYNEYDVFVNSGYDPSELTVFPLAEHGVNIPEDGLYCHSEYYEQNKELCTNFAEATLDGWIYALNHEEEALNIVLKYLRAAHLPANIPHQKWMLRKVREAVLLNPAKYGILTPEDYKASVEMMKDSGIINSYLPYEEFTGYADDGTD
jgi:NitT/TauT family transport system substrate-binding protein